MNWSLVPLMFGAVVFGYLGSWLQARLAGPVPDTEALPGPISPIGLAAFVLGAAGFVVAWWYVTRRPEATQAGPAEPSYRAAAWVGAIADAGYAVARGLSRAQSGALANYALGSFLGLSILLLVRVLVQ
jgi:hypothetical protein